MYITTNSVIFVSDGGFLCLQIMPFIGQKDAPYIEIKLNDLFKPLKLLRIKNNLTLGSKFLLCIHERDKDEVS